MNRRWLVRSIGLAIGFGVGIFGARTGAEGQACGSGFYAWSPAMTETNAGMASAPANDTMFNPHGPGTSYSYLAQGDTLFAIRNVAIATDGAAGSIKWAWQTPTELPIPNSAKPVLLSRGGEFIFLTAEDGFLYKVNAEDGATSNLGRDTLRLTHGVTVIHDSFGCGNNKRHCVLIIRDNAVCAADQVVATPAVQRYDSSNVAFRRAVDAGSGHNQDDLVFVITRNQCGDHTNNRIIAYWASDLTVKWIFNATGVSGVDSGNSECVIDYGTNTLFCGTHLEDPASAQNSLFALNSITGALRWSANAGSIHSRPVLFGGRLYVANLNGLIQAYDPATSLPLWGSPAALPTSIIRSIWPLPDPVRPILLVVGTDGILYVIRDDGDHAVHGPSATPSGAVFTTAPVAVQSLGKIYVGRSDGRIQQVSATGTLEGTVPVNSGADVYDPSLDIEGGASDFNRLVVAAGNRVTRLILPLCSVPPGS